jgi:uncharacterized protein (DUF3820 family)
MPEYTDETLMPFGQHKGKKLIDVPAKYLLWLEGELRRGDWTDLQAYIKDNKEVLEQQAKP